MKGDMKMDGRTVLTCPICGVACTDEDPETGEDKCPECRRVWYVTGNPEAPYASRSRTVRLKKLPEEGDRLSDCIEPVDPR
jgi:Zn-finger nucleic acid-binding protein